MKPPLRTRKGHKWPPPGTRTVPFEELVHHFEPESFEGTSRGLLALFDERDLAVDCRFARSGMPASADKGRDPVGWYRQEVRRIPTMEKPGEIRFCMGLEFLWRRLKAARLEAGWSIEEIEAFPDAGSLDKGLKGALLARTREFVEVRNELIERNLHIVLILLRRYRKSGVPQEDLIQEANASLFNAVKGFDFTRDVRFKTYAGFWVHQAFLKAIYDQSRTVRVPAYIQKAMKKIRDGGDGLAEKRGDLDALSRASGLSPEEVRKVVARNRYTFSLDRVVDADEGSTFMDLIEGEDEASPLDLGEGLGMRRRLAEALGTLESRERSVVEMRFGLNGRKVKTLGQVGELLGVSLERVRQIQNAALEKMRSSQGGRLLAQYA